MADRYDAVVVGARCAGAPTAMLLARQGHRVLLVDRATFPSDTLSTLLIHTPGLAALARWGLLDAVRATGCPGIGRFTFDFGPVVISGRAPVVDGIDQALAPRRTVLDALLVDAAREAGAEVCEGYQLEGLVVEDGVVVGVRGRDADGRPRTDRARVVVGADGWNSTVARAVGAEEYHRKPVLENAFYTFWRGLPVDGMQTLIFPHRGIAAIPTNDELTLVLIGCPFAQAADFRRDVEGNYAATLALSPQMAEAVAQAERVGPIVGGGVPNFFRVPFGPGWVLVGDAGCTKDPITAQGITNSFQTAEWCAEALDDAWRGRRPLGEALADYQQRRDEQFLPTYEFTTQLATLEPPPPELADLLGAVAGNQAAMDAFVAVNAGALSPAAFFDPAHLGALLGSAPAA